jgi:acetyltransferase-like isoleucine patch superfamily enzyme
VIGLIKSAVRRARLYLLRRRQFDSLALRAYFRRHHDVDVGLYSYGCFDQWRMRGPMRVGRYCSIAVTARSALANHPTDAITTHPALYGRSFGVIDVDVDMGGSLVIEDDVWVGHNAIILAGCKRIGRGAVIGAGSIVTRDVERYAVMAGNPARKIRDRFEPELAEAIEASRWWELSLGELRTLVERQPDLIFHPSVEALQAWTGRRA